MQLDAKRKWNMVEMEKRRIVEEEQRKHLEHDLDHENVQLQRQLRDDVSSCCVYLFIFCRELYVLMIVCLLFVVLDQCYLWNDLMTTEDCRRNYA